MESGISEKRKGLLQILSDLNTIMKKVITIENLSKKYIIGHLGEKRDTTLRDVIVKSANSAFHKTKNLFGTKTRMKKEEYWALKDVSFDVCQGERIGIIGRNGAGKSTLLKILSRITEPTEGSVRLTGRVASLLEVGTGFHPELTGRENIFLNGAILGMSKGEIKRKFDEIVAFSEIEKFLDTPVKRYSSGMYVRLAFAVAAHLEPEILIVDEVLAVGDVQFQRKCLDKMEDAGKGGRTVLFVSHNMSAIRQLCSRCIMLEKGTVRASGDPIETIDLYLENAGKALENNPVTIFPIESEKDFQMKAVRVCSSNELPSCRFECDEPVIVQIDCIVRKRIPGLFGYFRVTNKEGLPILVSDSFDNSPNAVDNLSPGEYKITIKIPSRTLGHGEYTLFVSFASLQGSNGFYVHEPDKELCNFTIEDTVTNRGNRRQGFFSTILKWDIMSV